MHFGYRARLVEFLAEDASAIAGQLHQFIVEDGFRRLWTAQTSAWLEEIQLLKITAKELMSMKADSAQWTVLLEYEIARRGRRIDAILLTTKTIIVLEFKVGLEAEDSHSRWQVLDLVSTYETSTQVAEGTVSFQLSSPLEPVICS